MNQLAITDFSSFRLLCKRIAEHERPQLTTTSPVWIFGAGNFGCDVCKTLLRNGFDVHGFLDSNPKSETILGLPVLTWNQLKTHQFTSQLVIGIFNRGIPLDELEILAHSAGFTNVFMPWHVYTQFGQELGWRFWLSPPETILDNQSLLEEVYQSLADDESRQCLLEICAFRLGQHTAYAKFNHTEQQYFNSLTLKALPAKKTSYIDGGAYNGDTFLELTDKTEIESAYLFEPDPENFRSLAKAVISNGSNIMCLPLALTDQYSILSFSAGNGEGGTISEAGNVHIATVALDKLLPNQHIDFIKLDVEGAEIQALEGAIKLIKRSSPILAISLYHKPQDIWEIPLFVRKTLPNHKIYIRQHYYNSFDSVLYSVPAS